MVRTIAAALIAVALSFSTVTLAQDAPKKEGTKEAKKEMHKGELKSVSCAPECGFMVRSHDEKELTSIVMSHAKSAHNKDMTEADIKAMMKTKKPEKTKKGEKDPDK